VLSFSKQIAEFRNHRKLRKKRGLARIVAGLALVIMAVRKRASAPAL